jgi:hypothetical protein
MLFYPVRTSVGLQRRCLSPLPDFIEMHLISLLICLVATMGTVMASRGIQNVSDYSVQFDIANPSTGINTSFTIDIYSGWAELGSAQFRSIITEKAWIGARFFRVVPGK